jgi:hypothetical protein
MNQDADHPADDGDTPAAVCPNCGREPYQGSANGRPVYRCQGPGSKCQWYTVPLARTKAQLRRVNAYLADESPSRDVPAVVYCDSCGVMNETQQGRRTECIDCGEPLRFD